jgi:endonuclease I
LPPNYLKMNRIITFMMLAVISAATAQAPANYYNNANGFTGYTLKSKLKAIITAGHNGKSYNNLFTDPLAFKSTDRDYFYENDGTVLDMYSEKPNGPDSYNYNFIASDKCGNYNSEADCYNGEHIVPQSTYNSGMPMVGDIHQLLPTDGYVNNRRSNYPFANISNPTWTSTNGSKLGQIQITGYSGYAFEPIDEFKGDIARILFYFATRYETQVDSWGFPMFNGTESQVFKPAFLQILKEWHDMDPVSDFEIARNNAAYTYQGNRNPYIDHPEYVAMIWGPTTPLGVDTYIFADLQVYPNPSNTQSITIATTALIENIQIINLNGQMIREVQQPDFSESYTISNLPQGFYLLKVTSDDKVMTRKIIIN